MTKAALALLAALAATPACAEPATARVRGTVVSRDGDRLVIRRPGGSTLTLAMDPKTRVFAVNGARTRDIKPESYLAVVAGPGPDDERAERRAERVTLFSPSERGFEAGRRPWDTAPGASLTAGWVADLSGAETRRVTLSYADGRSAFAIAPGTPVTQVSPGEKALLEPGAAVTAFTSADPDGALRADLVAVGRLGAVPTL